MTFTPLSSTAAALRTGVALGVLLAVLCTATAAHGQRRIRDICRVKGQEENTLHGLGLVVGLKGTGDGDHAPTLRALAKMLSVMGNPLPGLNGLGDLNARNAALVWVTAEVPAAGAREGGRLNCRVSSVGAAKSLDGGYLVMTPLVGPRPGSDVVYGLAQGPLHLEDSNRPLTARVHAGCRLERDFFNAYADERSQLVTLVLQNHHADFQTAYDVADLINSQLDFQDSSSAEGGIARAIDQVNVVIRIPAQYRDDPVSFISNVLNTQLLQSQNVATVVVNERSSVVVIGANVDIGPLAISHKNLVIQAGQPLPDSFLKLDPNRQGEAKLTALVEALNALKAPPADVIEIIKTIDRSGALYGRLIVE